MLIARLYVSALKLDGKVVVLLPDVLKPVAEPVDGERLLPICEPPNISVENCNTNEGKTLRSLVPKSKSFSPI